MDGLQPTIDIGGNNNGGWGNWGGALIGGAIGAAFGSGWKNKNGRKSYANLHKFNLPRPALSFCLGQL